MVPQGFINSWQKKFFARSLLEISLLQVSFPLSFIEKQLTYITVKVLDFPCGKGFFPWDSFPQMAKNLPAIGRPGFDPLVGKTPWRRAWQPTPVFLPGEFHGQRSLADYSPWGCKESGHSSSDWAHRHKPQITGLTLKSFRFRRSRMKPKNLHI